MSSAFESLPKELIAHIATFVEALSIVHLSRTSKTVRAACWDALLFKQVLQQSQRRNWRDNSLDIDAISRRAGNDPSGWARYAVADDKAWVLAGMKDPLQSRKNSIHFLPELAVVKHPFLKQPCWHMATHGPFDYLVSHVFSVTMAALSSDDRTSRAFHDPGACEYCFPKPRENDPAFLSAEGSLWTLCSMAIRLRSALTMRRDAWPYNEMANVPHIDFPRAGQIPLSPLDDTYSLPLPFSHTALELLNRLKLADSRWDEWHSQHNHALHNSGDLLTLGSWCGYCIHSSSAMPLDPPMMDIRFKRGANIEKDFFSISADHCIDGLGKFSLRGSVSWEGRTSTISAQKTYDQGSIGDDWDWDCRLTPFGIVGHWGRGSVGGFLTRGYVWLWKREWTENTTAQET